MARQATNLKIKSDLQALERVEGRAGNDTIRLWESYREQSFLWRALALLQIPATALSIAAALVMFFFADTVIEVPESPQPGYYSVKQLPDAKFISVATDIVNLIGTYQPKTVREQFITARKYLWEPALTQFENEMMKREVQTIEETTRSQLFFVNPSKVVVERYPNDDYVVVRIPGIRYKMVGPEQLPSETAMYYVKMTTIPRNVHNQYGIVVVDMRFQKMPEN